MYIVTKHLRVFRVIELSISTKDAYYTGKIVWDYRDPFDRLLAAQAINNNLALISNDEAFRMLPELDVIW